LPIFAQNDVDFPPSPEEIFALDVTLIAEDNGDAYIDNDQRRIAIYDTEDGTWRTFDFPFPANEPVSVRLDNPGRSDGRWLVTNTRGQSSQAWWLLDPNSGVYTPYEVLCNRRSYALWTLYVDENSGYTYLCNTETGALSIPLPDRHDSVPINWDAGYPYDVTLPSHSPDGRFIMVYGYDATLPDRFNSSIIYAYVYNTQTDAVSFLGELRGVVTDVWRWGDNYVALRQRYNLASYSRDQFFYTDLDNPQGLTSLANLRYYEDVDRYLGFRRDSETWLCMFIRFDPNNGHWEEFPQSIGCESDTIRQRLPGGTDYLITTTNRDEDTRPVSRTMTLLNPLTGDQTDLFTGEIEDWVVPRTQTDQLVLILDSSGMVDNHFDFPEYDFANYTLPTERVSHPYYAFFDLHTREIFHTIETDWEFYGMYVLEHCYVGNGIISDTCATTAAPTDDIIQLSNDRFIHYEVLTDSNGDGYRQYTLLAVHDGVIQRSVLPARPRFWLREIDTLILADTTVYEVSTGLRSAPLFSESQYTPSIVDVVDGRYLRIGVANRSVVYTVQLPQTNP